MIISMVWEMHFLNKFLIFKFITYKPTNFLN
jgi:hypothetical protein